MRISVFSLGRLLGALCMLSLFASVPVTGLAVPRSSRMMPIVPEDSIAIAAHDTLPTGEKVASDAVLLLISIQEQRLLVARNGEPVRAYAISTARAGMGARANSGCTPLGWHRVSDWIGGDAVPGQVFVSRKPVGGVIPRSRWSDPASADRVMTRVLWLDGMEEGINRGPGIDSHSRFIYLHGTNQEHLLGKPASHGCIRLANRDVMELYDLTIGHPTYCLILPKY